MDEMYKIVICEHCNEPEYYGNMLMLNGKYYCRDCYKANWETMTNKLYVWDDLDGYRPTMEEYKKQEDMRNK